MNKTNLEHRMKKLNKEKIFVEHIEQHLKDLKIEGKVLCKICGKDIDKIAEEAREVEGKSGK